MGILRGGFDRLDSTLAEVREALAARTPGEIPGTEHLPPDVREALDRLEARHAWARVQGSRNANRLRAARRERARRRDGEKSGEKSAGLPDSGG